MIYDLLVDPGTFGSIGEYRYVIIPNGTPVKSNTPDLNDYYAVMEYFGINP